MTFGEKLKTVRKEKGVTQQQLAILLNINVQTVRSYEGNKYQPSREKREKLAQVLNVPAIYFEDYFQDSLDSAINLSFIQKGRSLVDNLLMDIFRNDIIDMSTYYDDAYHYQITIDGRKYALPHENLYKIYDLIKSVTKSVVEYSLLPEEEYLDQLHKIEAEAKKTFERYKAITHEDL